MYSTFTKAANCKELRDILDKYLKSPGTLSISKQLHEIYKSLEIELPKEGEEPAIANKSENESEPEQNSSYLKEHIFKMDNQPFEFVPISLNVIYCEAEHDRTEIIYGNVQGFFHEQANRSSRMKSSRILFQAT